MEAIKILSLFCAIHMVLISPAFSAEEQNKKSSTQQIGGLLFDVDEGVKVEQGPGGSVYMKSNREYMQSKFNEIEERFKDLEQRISLLEAQSGSQGGKTVSEPAPPADNSGRKVLQS